MKTVMMAVMMMVMVVIMIEKSSQYLVSYTPLA